MTNGFHHAHVTEIDSAAMAAANAVFVALQQLTGIKTQPVPNIEEPGWLIQSDKRFKESWAAVHVSNVSQGLQALLGKLQHVFGSRFAPGHMAGHSRLAHSRAISHHRRAYA